MSKSGHWTCWCHPCLLFKHVVNIAVNWRLALHCWTSATDSVQSRPCGVDFFDPSSLCSFAFGVEGYPTKCRKRRQNCNYSVNYCRIHVVCLKLLPPCCWTLILCNVSSTYYQYHKYYLTKLINSYDNVKSNIVNLYEIDLYVINKRKCLVKCFS